MKLEAIYKNKYFYPAVLVVATVIVYWPILFNQFLMAWDDQWVCINEYTDAGFSSENLWYILTEFYHGQYAPVNELYYLTIHEIFGYNPFWFHLGSMLLHIANVILVWLFIGKILERGSNLGTTAQKRIAFFTALLFAVHPFNTEAVAWISASKILLYAFFYLLALLAYLKYTESLKRHYYLLTLSLYIVSFGAKEQAVVFVFALLLIDWWILKRKMTKEVWLEKMPFFLLALFFGIITIFSQQGWWNFSSGSEGYPIYQRIVFASYSFFEYLVKCLLPIKLSYLYPFPNQPGESMPVLYYIYPIVILVATVTLWNFWKKRWVFFGVALFAIHLGVALHIISLSRFAIVADRYAYLSAVGLFFILAYYFSKAIDRKMKYGRMLTVACLIYAISIGAYAHERTKVWYNTESVKKELRGMLKKREGFERVKELKSEEYKKMKIIREKKVKSK